MHQVTLFYSSFAATLVAVAVTAVLGRLARRRPHVAAAAVAGGTLGWTIFVAERLGRSLVIPELPLKVHLVFANAGAIAFLVVVVTGVRLFRRELAARRRWHRRAVIAFVVLTIAAATTGSYMLSHAAPRPPAVRID